MSTSRAERLRLAALIAINQHFLFGFGRFLDFHGFSKTPPLSKIRKFQEIDEIKTINGVFVENHKFTENHQETLRRMSGTSCLSTNHMPRLIPSVCGSVGINRATYARAP